jgi:hypothetical protein
MGLEFKPRVLEGNQTYLNKNTLSVIKYGYLFRHNSNFVKLIK